MTIEALIKLIQSYGKAGKPEADSLRECLEGLISKLHIEENPGIQNFNKLNQLRAYVLELEKKGH